MQRKFKWFFWGLAILMFAGHASAELTPLDTTNPDNYLKISDADARRVGLKTRTLNDGSKVLYVIGTDFPHHELHEGNFHGLCGVTSLTSSQQLQIVFLAPAEVEQDSHFKMEVGSSAALLVQIWEAPTVNTGLAIPTYNHNRNSSNVANTLFWFAAADASAEGTVLCMEQIGQGNKTPGASRSENEWILKYDTYYILALSGLAAGGADINYKVGLYEADEAP